MIADTILDYLATKGLVIAAVNGFVAYAPSSPDDILVIYPTGGLESDGKIGYDTVTFQVFVRSASAINGYTLASAVYNELQGLHRVTIGGIHIVNCIGIQSAPEIIGVDDDERSQYTQNYQITVRNITLNRV